MAEAAPSLGEIIRAKQAELEKAEAVVLRLRNELSEAKRLLLGTTQPVPRVASNSTEMAELVLQKAGEDLHVNDIISGIEREFHVSVRYATLVGNLSRLVKRRKTFERVGPNRFGLLEWAVQREADELFGRSEMERQESD